MKSVVLVLALAACAKINSVACDDGRTCPSGTVCDDKHLLCVSEEQASVCIGMSDASPCTAKTLTGHCLDDVCLPSVCGDGVTEFGEMCDDHNTVEEDPTAAMRCSADCTSTRVCGNGVPDENREEQCDDGNLLDHDGCSSLCRTETARWVRHTVAPPKLDKAAAAYDSKRGRLVVFGGTDDTTSMPSGTTYEWTGADWIIVDVGGPSPRYLAATAYDSDRGEVVMFGGFDSTWDLQDTWTYDGREWRQHDVVGPSERYGSMLVHDPKRHVTVLFGGWNDTAGPLDDTWEWDGAAWHQITVTTPKPFTREGAAAAFDPKAGVIVMTGGNDARNAVIRTDTWTYDGQWHDMTAGIQPGVQYGSMAWDVAGQRMLLVAGQNASSTDVNTMWSLSGTTWTNLGAAPFSARNGAAIGNTATGIVLFGGDTSAATSETWLFTTTWKQLQAPLPRKLMTAANDNLNARVLLFGGSTISNTKLNETWELSTSGYKQHFIASPSARVNHQMVWDDARRQVLLYGGQSSAGVIGDTWTGAFDNGTYSWSSTTPSAAPPPIMDGKLGFDGSRAILFGGTTTGSVDNVQTRAWDGTTWARLDDGPARTTPAMGWDPIRKQLVMFGGHCLEDGFPYDCADTWLFTGTGWMKRDLGFRPPRSRDVSLVWNPARARLTLITGSGSISAAFEWDGSSWFPVVTSNHPDQLFDATTFASPDGGGVTQIGGTILSAGAPEQLELRYDATPLQERCDGKDADGDGLQGCADPDCWSICAPLCPPGVTCDVTASPRCGDHTCQSPRESCRTCSEDCAACPPVCGDAYCDPGETGCPGDCP